MNETLTINPAFEQLIPELSEDEFSQLEENILKEGMVINPIIVWKGVIIDGHNRYRIVQKHSDIPFTVHEKNFDNEYAASAWICSNQLGRRNLTEQYKRYLRGKRYNIERDMESFHGNQYTSHDESGLDGFHPDQNGHGTRSRMAKELGVTQWMIQTSADYTNGVDAAEEILPGIKKEILTGLINPSKKDVAAIAKMPASERKEAVELLRVPKDQRKANESLKQIEDNFEAKNEQNEVTEGEGGHTHEIEESILDSMIGTLNMFIESINDYLSRFPKLRTEPKYRDQTKEIMIAARKYINDVEGALK